MLQGSHAALRSPSGHHVTSITQCMLDYQWLFSANFPLDSEAALARKASEVRVGQRYREVGTSFLGSPTPLWAVEGIFTSTDSLTYVRLTNVADPSLRKTLSTKALTDRQRYVLEAAER